MYHYEKLVFFLSCRKSTYKSVSNIHQLNTKNSDDDENNTYNGNSTQQM